MPSKHIPFAGELGNRLCVEFDTRVVATGEDAVGQTIVDRLRVAGCVFAEDEARLLRAAADGASELESLVSRRESGVPLEHVLGWAEFCGIRVSIDPGVFVPRRRTELLVREATLLVREGSVVVDLCCGSGAVGVAVAATSAHSVTLFASDIEPTAVACAKKNVEPLGGEVLEGDLFAPYPDDLRGCIDVLVANAPYVPTGAIDLMPREARLFEPFVTLDGGADGLDLHRRIADVATEWLAPGGHLLIETSIDQAPVVGALLASAGLEPRIARDDDLDATVVIGGNPRIGHVHSRERSQ